MLSSILPSNNTDAKISAVSLSDQQWEDFLVDKDEENEPTVVPEPKPEAEDGDEDLYVYGDEDLGKAQAGDWTGVDRDRRSAYLIIGALRGEGLL